MHQRAQSDLRQNNGGAIQFNGYDNNWRNEDNLAAYNPQQMNKPNHKRAQSHERGANQGGIGGSIGLRAGSIDAY